MILERGPEDRLLLRTRLGVALTAHCAAVIGGTLAGDGDRQLGDLVEALEPCSAGPGFNF